MYVIIRHVNILVIQHKFVSFLVILRLKQYCKEAFLQLYFMKHAVVTFVVEFFIVEIPHF